MSPPLASSLFFFLWLGAAFAQATADFQDFNEIFQNAQLVLPDADISTSGLDLSIRDLVCSQVVIDDMTVVSPPPNGNTVTSIQLQVNIQFSLICEANYSYRFPPFFRGSGRVGASTRNNQFATQWTVTHHRPTTTTSVTVNLCQAQIDIYNLDFRGGLVARIVDLASKPVSDILQREIQEALCEQLSSNGGAALEALLDSFLMRVDPAPPVLQEPALVERQVLSSSSSSSVQQSSLFDFSEHEWLKRGLEQVQLFLGSSSGSSERDLGINVLLRNRILNTDGTLLVNLEDVMENTTILSSHGRLTESSIVLQNLEIDGLDSLTRFDALQIVSNYTVRNTLRWESLRVRIQARIIMQASSQENSLFVVSDGQPTVVEEDIVIEAGLEDLVINLNLLFATEEEFWRTMPLGDVLDTSTLYNCFLQSIKLWNVTELTATAGRIVRPTLEGFIDAGLDRIASSAVEAFLNLFEPTFQEALPNLAQTIMRDWVNTELLPNLRQDVPACPTTVTWPTPLVDFRDLLLPPKEAQALGGSGEQPYGDLVHQGYDALVKKFSEWDELNNFLIRPWTSSQSGVAGTFALLEQDLVVVDHSLVDFSLSDLQIRNLDTIQHDPIQILNPTEKPTVIANEIQLGNATVDARTSISTDSSALTFAFQTQFRLGDWVPQQKVAFSVTMPKVKLDASLNLALNSSYVSNLPLGHASKLACWMKAIVTEKTDMMIEALSLEMAPWQWQAQCMNCSSEILSSVLGKMQSSNVMSEQWPVLVTDLLESDYIEEWLLYQVDSASCPLVPNISSVMKPAGIPILSEASLDTAVYTGVVSLWTTFLVIMEQHAQQEEPVDSPKNLSGREDDTNLIDFTNLGNSTGLGTLADEALQQGRDYLLGRDEATQQPKINSLMRDWLLSNENGNEDYVLRVPNMEQIVFRQENGLLLRIDAVAVRGLDTFTQLGLFEPINPQLLWSTLQLRSLSLQVNTTVGYTEGTQQNVTFFLELEDLELELELFAAFPLDAMQKIPLKSVLLLKNILPCILSTAQKVEIPHLNATIGRLSSVQVYGLQTGSDEAMSNLIQETLTDYQETIINGLPQLATSSLRTLLSNMLSDFVNSANCPLASSSANNPYVDLRELLLTPDISQQYGGAGDAPYGNIFPTIANYIKDEILSTDPETGVLALNNLINSFTERRSGVGGTLLWPGDLLSTDTNVDAGGLNARVRLRVYDAFIHNIDSFSGQDMQILEPVRGEPHQVNNSASIGKRQPIEMGAGFAVEFFSPGGTDINNDLQLSLSADDVQILFSMLLKIVETSFLDLPLAAIGNLDCWLATFEKPKLDQFGVSQSSPALELLELSLLVTQLRMNATCVSCSGPKMEEFTKLLLEPRAIEDVTRVTNRVLSYLRSVLGGNYLQVTFDRMIAEGHRKCPYGSDYGNPAPEFQSLPEPDTSGSMSLLVALFLSALVLLTCLVVILLGRRVFVRWRHRKWVQSLAEDQLHHLWNIQTEQDKLDEEINRRSQSLFRSDDIPIFARFFIPFLILGNVALFLSGHLSLGGSVTIVLQLAGESYTADNFFEFSMAKSAIEIWNAGGKELAIMILIFSGIWPYTKCVTTMFLWFAPPRICPVDRRDNILLWLDALAKWSFVDIFILVMTLAAFRVSVQSPNVAFLPDSFYSLDLLVIPKWGLYANMIAQLISQISSHFIIHFHRSAVTKAKQEMDEPSTPKTLAEEDDTADLSEASEDVEERLCEHHFERPHRGEDEKLVVRSYVAPIFMFMTASIICLVIAGCSVPSYGVNILGLVGLLVESGREFSQAVFAYNLFDTLKLLFDQASFTGSPRDYIGLGSLSIVLLTTVLVVPLVQSAVLTYLWFKPMAAKQRFRTMVALEVLSAWQYAEVFLISVVVASWQLGPVSEYMINAYCGSLQGFFSQLVFYGVVEDQDAQCFRVDTTIDTGFFILAAGALMLALLNTFVIHAVRQQQRDKARSPFCGSTFGCGEDLEKAREKIHPAPVLFTDSFRWLLRGAESEDLSES